MVWTTFGALYYMLSSSQIISLLYRSYFTDKPFIGIAHHLYVSSLNAGPLIGLQKVDLGSGGLCRGAM